MAVALQAVDGRSDPSYRAEGHSGEQGGAGAGRDHAGAPDRGGLPQPSRDGMRGCGHQRFVPVPAAAREVRDRVPAAHGR